MTTRNSDISELKRIVRGAAGKVAMDSANRAGISLTRSERQALKFKRQPTALDTAKPGTAQRGDRRLQSGPVSGFYRHPGQSANDSNELENRDLFGVEADEPATAPNSNDPESLDDALSSDEREQLAVSLRAAESTTLNEAGARMTGLEQANQEYARRKGFQPTHVS